MKGPRIEGSPEMWERIATLLKEKRRPWARLAEAMEVTSGSLSKTKNEQGGLREITLLRAAEFLNSTPEYIEFGEGPAHPGRLSGPGADVEDEDQAQEISEAQAREGESRDSTAHGGPG